MLVRQLGAGLYEAIAFWQEDKTAPELKIFRNLQISRQFVRGKVKTTINNPNPRLNSTNCQGISRADLAVIFLASQIFRSMYIC